MCLLLGFLCVFWSISDEFAVAFFGVYVGQFAMDIMSWSAFERWICRFLRVCRLKFSG